MQTPLETAARGDEDAPHGDPEVWQLVALCHVNRSAEIRDWPKWQGARDRWGHW